MELDICWIYAPFYYTFSGADLSLIGAGAELKASTTISRKIEL